MTGSKKIKPARNLRELKIALRRFAADRDWDKFHSPKNLAVALSVEASELLEQFQWLTEIESRRITGRRFDCVQDELADVQIYLVRLADKLGVDLLDAARQKIQKNARKYPTKKACGSSKKYTEL